jgi:hypothetical protein
MNESRLRIGVYLLAVALFGALPVPAAFAEDADGTHNNGSGANPSAATGGSQAPSGEDAISASGGREPDDIDTRITVQPHRVNGKPDKATDLKAKPNAPAVKNLHRRTFSASRASTATVRNAISTPITSPQGVERQEGAHLYAPSISHGAAAGTSARPEVGIVRPNVSQQFANPPAPTFLNRGVGGTSVSRRGGPSGIGGPAKTTVGINGSTIRPAHSSSP